MQQPETSSPALESLAVCLGLPESSPPSGATPNLEADQKRLRRRLIHRSWVERNKERRKAQLKRWYAANKDINRIKFRKWQQANRERLNAYKRKIYKKDRAKLLLRHKLWYQRNREAVLLNCARYGAEHRLERQAYAKKYHPLHYAKNKERLIAQTKAYAKAHPEVRAKAARNYKKRHPEKYAAYLKVHHVRRAARRRGADVSDKAVSGVIRRWRMQKNFVCFYCGKRFEIKKLEVDHVVPISKGGKHSVSNICKSCRPCNIRKRATLIEKHSVNGQPFLL